MKRFLFLALAMISVAPQAFAHAMLERANPGAGSAVATSPPELSLTFSEGVEPLFSTIELRDAKNATVTIGKPHVGSGNNRQLIVDLPNLPPGSYSVIWHVTSVDTHKTQGNYKFTIGP